MKPLRALFAGLMALALLSAGSALAQNAPAAQRVLDRARAVSGGAAAWNGLRGLHAVGEEAGKPYERWTDPLRYGDRVHVLAAMPGGALAQGYNGAYEWRIMGDGGVTGSNDAELNARARTEAFLAAHGYFFPSRFDLRTTHLGVRESRGRRFDVLRTQPAGGRPRELWFDRQTGLLGLVIDETGGKRVTTELSDYRKVGKVMLPFVTVTTGGDLTAPRRRELKTVDFPVVGRDLFTLSQERVHRKPGTKPPLAP